MKIYISGKISGLSEEEYTDNFEKVKLNLWETDFCFSIRRYSHIISPLDIKPFLGIKSWLFYMIADIWQLRKCNHIAMQKNWTDSKGAVIEYFFAKWIFKQQIIWL